MSEEDIVQEFDDEMSEIAEERERSKQVRKGSLKLDLRRRANVGFFSTNEEWEVAVSVTSVIGPCKKKSFDDNYKRAREYFEKLKDKHGFKEEVDG